MTKTINKVLTEVYKHDGALRSQVKSGFATISQKSKIVKLKVLHDAIVSVGDTSVNIKAGSKLLISEEILYSAPWAKNPTNLDDYQCIVVEPTYIIGFEE